MSANWTNAGRHGANKPNFSGKAAIAERNPPFRANSETGKSSSVLDWLGVLGGVAPMESGRMAVAVAAAVLLYCLLSGRALAAGTTSAGDVLDPGAAGALVEIAVQRRVAADIANRVAIGGAGFQRQVETLLIDGSNGDFIPLAGRAYQELLRSAGTEAENAAGMSALRVLFGAASAEAELRTAGTIEVADDEATLARNVALFGGGATAYQTVQTTQTAQTYQTNQTPIQTYDATAYDAAAYDATYDAPARIAGRRYIALANTVLGQAATAGVVAGIETARSNSGLIGARQAELRREVWRIRSGSSPDGTPEGDASRGLVHRVWASPFRNSLRQRDSDGYSGYEYRTSGLALGYDRVFGRMSAGAAFIYGGGAFEWLDTSEDNRTDNYSGALYAQYYGGGGFFANADAGFNRSVDKWARNISAVRLDDPSLDGWERSRSGAWSYWLGGAVGREFSFASGAFVVSPSVGLYYYGSRSGAFTSAMGGEGGVRPFMRYGGMSKSSLLLPVEATASYTVRVGGETEATFRGTAGYSYNLQSGAARGSAVVAGAGDMWRVVGMESPRHGWKVGVGLGVRHRIVDIEFDYRYEGGGGSARHEVKANVGLRF